MESCQFVVLRSPRGRLGWYNTCAIAYAAYAAASRVRCISHGPLRYKFLTKTALLGGEDSAEARAERAEAKVAALMEKVAELNATVGELKGENKVLREDRDTIREKLFSMLGAGAKQ